MDCEEPPDSIAEKVGESLSKDADERAQTKQRRYRKNSGFSGFRGEAFEYKTCALLFARGSNEKYKFEMGSSVKNYVGFDDIVFVFITPDNSKFCLFLQLKNKSKNKIRFDNLVSKKHDFSLRKLYESYIKIEEKFTDELFAIDVKFENCIFVLYTNANVDSETLKLNDVVKCGPEKIAMTGGSVLRLNERDHREVYEELLDLPKLKDFLNRFTIMYNQASENDLNPMISDEINKYLMLSEEEREPAFYKFLDLIQDWWKKPKFSTYLTDSYVDHNPLRKTLEHIKDMRITTLMKERRSETDKLDLKFCDTALRELENVLERKKVTLILTPPYLMKITSAKIHQHLNAEYGILRIEDFNEQETDILNSYKFKYIVMYVEKSSQQFDVICLNLSKFLLKDSQNTKIIFIMNENNVSDMKLLKKHFDNELEIHFDRLAYDILSSDIKTDLLKKIILFQGHELELNKIGIRSLHWLDEPSLSLLLQEDKPEIGAKPPDLVDYYIQRSLQRHINLNPNARKLKRILSTSWKPESIMDGEDRVVVVTSEPGMGKSTLLTHLFRTTKELHPNIWVLRVNINDFTKMLDKFKKSGVQKGDALKLLESASAENSRHAITELEKKLLNYSYEETENLIVLVDGVDEISPDYGQVVFQILRELYHSKVKRMWVTSRPYLKLQLEKLFNVQSVSLIPFDTEDQKSFLTKFWKSKTCNLDEEILETFLKHVLQMSNKFLNVKDLNFKGIPLQILLLAEIYLEKFECSCPTQELNSLQNVNITMLYEKYIDKKWKICNEEKLKTDLTKVQAVKHDVILKKEFKKNNTFAALLTLFSNDELNSLKDDSVKIDGEKYIKEIEEEGDKTGLIVGVFGGKAQFVHRTMAEYFAAKWIFKYLEANKCFLKKYIFKSKHKVIRQLLDSFLLEDYPLHMSVLNRNLSENSEWLQMNRCDRMGRTALHIAVEYELPNETKILLQHGADVSVKDKLMEWTPVEYAEKMYTLSAEDLDGLLLGTISNNNKLVNAQIMEARPETIKVWASRKKRDMCHESYLYIAAKEGLVNLLTHFIEKRADINAKIHGGHRLMLHELSYYGHVETVKLILKQGAKCDIVDGYRNTALHISVGRNHHNVVALLLDSGININSRNISGCTALHLAVILYKYDMVKLLVSKGADINSKDIYDYTPLSIARSSADENMIRLLQNPAIKVAGSEV